MSTSDVPGTYIDPKAAAIRWHKTDETVAGKRYRANIADGILLAVLSHDPAGPNGELLWHISVSHRASVVGSDGGEVFMRCPTWDELKSAKYQLVPVDVAMSILFPKKTEPYLNRHPTTLHLWETDNQ